MFIELVFFWRFFNIQNLSVNVQEKIFQLSLHQNSGGSMKIQLLNRREGTEMVRSLATSIITSGEKQ